VRTFARKLLDQSRVPEAGHRVANRRATDMKRHHQYLFAQHLSRCELTEDDVRAKEAIRAVGVAL
jgi:hypothetical protein